MEALGRKLGGNVRICNGVTEIMEVRVLKTEEEFLQCRDTWEGIYQAMEESTPFQKWEWSYAWWCGHKNGALLIFEVYEAKEVFAYAPFIVIGKRVEFIGEKHFDYGMLICAERKNDVFENVFQKLNEVCKENKWVYRLNNIPISSAQNILFKEQSKDKKVLFREQVYTAKLHLKEYKTFENYLRSISSSLRKKAIKPCLKKNLTYQVEEYSEELWHDIEQIYLSRQQDRVGVSNLGWAKQVVQKLNKENLLQISTLLYEGERVAFLMFFTAKESYYVWLTAFKDVENLRLGHFIRYCLIQKAYANQIKAVDMMRGAYDYKKEWDCNIYSNYQLIKFKSRIAKRCYMIKLKVRSWIRLFIYNHKRFKKLYKKVSKHKG